MTNESSSTTPRKMFKLKTQLFSSQNSTFSRNLCENEYTSNLSIEKLGFTQKEINLFI